MEKTVQQVKVEKNLSFTEARPIVEDLGSSMATTVMEDKFCFTPLLIWQRLSL